MHRLFKIALSSVLVLFLLPGPLGAVRDVGATAIVFPKGLIRWAGQPLQVQAQAVVRNFADSAASFPVLLRIDDQTAETTRVQDLAPLTSDTVEFPITLPESAEHTISCSTALTGDVQRGNDWVLASFRVLPRDIGIKGIELFPGDSLCIGDSFFCCIWVENYWFALDACPLLFTISSAAGGELVFADTALVELAPTEDAHVTFGPWMPEGEGLFRCQVRIDTIPLMDTVPSFFVTVLPSGVQERETPDAGRIAPIPTIVRGVLELPPGKPGQSTAGQSLVLLLDATGRCIAALHPGRNDMTRFPPGVYFVRLLTPNFAESKKLILMQ